MSDAILDNATGAFYDDFDGRSAEFTQVVRTPVDRHEHESHRRTLTDAGQVGEDYKASNVEFLP